MSDLIDRQAAIDAIKSNRFPGAPYVDTGMEIALRLVRELPSAYEGVLDKSVAKRILMQSAQPEIIRCKDCRHNHNCDIQYHAQAGNMFFCAGAERREK